MAGMTDPSWGNIFNDMFSGFQAAPAQSLDMIAKVDAIKNERAKQAAAVATGNAYEQNAMLEQPPMGSREVVGPMVGDINSPLDVQGMPTGNIPAPPDPRDVAAFEAKRKFAIATARQAALQNQMSAMFPLMAQGKIAMTGLPDDQGARDVLQAQLNNTIREPKATPFMVVGADGVPIQSGASSDNFKTDLSGRPISAPPGGSIQPTALPAAGQSIYGNKDLQMQELVRLENKVRGGTPLSENEVQRGGILLDAVYPQAGAYQAVPGGRQYQVTRPAPVPDSFSGLNGLVSAYRSGAHLQPPQQQQQPPQPAPQQGPTSLPPEMFGGLSGTPAPAAPQPPPTPIVPQQPPQAAANLNDPQLGPVLGEAAKAETIKDTRAVSIAQAARQKIESAIGIKDGNVPANPYLPNIALTILNERAGSTVEGRYAIGKMDPEAKAYFVATKQWVEQVLRIASGAAIRPEEYAEYYGMFIPEAGDTRAVVAQKLNAMRLWEQSTAGAQTANEALTKMQAAAQGDPTALALAQKLRVRATDLGTINKPIKDIPEIVPEPDQAATAASPDHNKIRQQIGR